MKIDEKGTRLVPARGRAPSREPSTRARLRGTAGDELRRAIATLQRVQERIADALDRHEVSMVIRLAERAARGQEAAVARSLRKFAKAIREGLFE